MINTPAYCADKEVERNFQALYIKPKQDHIAVFYNVIFSLHADKSLFARRRE